VVEQVIRPTGLVDPEVDIRPTTGQIDDLRERIDATVAAGYRVLVTTLTKKMAEDLTDYLTEQGVRVQYLHSDVDTMARIEILRELRLGTFDVLVGINLLREGLDLPEVALVAILDADKEGFLRSSSSLIQTMGRAARNVNGRVVMYADRITDSMTTAIGETQRRRARQIAYNLEHGIDPRTITKSVTDILERVRGEGIGSAAITSGPNTRAAANRAQRGRAGGVDPRAAAAEMAKALGPDSDELSSLVHRLDAEMNKAAEELRFEEAALLRDEITELRALLVRDPVDGSAVLSGDTADVEATADV
jgi:excinuclease ABC subunit B